KSWSSLDRVSRYCSAGATMTCSCLLHETGRAGRRPGRAGATLFSFRSTGPIAARTLPRVLFCRNMPDFSKIDNKSRDLAARGRADVPRTQHCAGRCGGLSLDQTCRSHPVTDPVALTAALIRCPSVTPAEGGALQLVADRLTAAGFVCTRVDR